MQTPALITAIQQIHQDRLRHDGNAGGPHLQATPDFAQPGLNAARRIQSEGRTARQHEGVHRFHRHRGVEQAGIAPARRTTQNRTGSDDGLFENNRRNTGAKGKIGDITDRNAAYVSQKICECRHAVSLFSRYPATIRHCQRKT